MAIKKKWITLIFLAAWLVLTTIPVFAHIPWLSLPEHNPEKGGKIKIFLGWGHKFPLDDFLKTDAVTGMTLYAPDGKSFSVAAINDFMFETEALDQEGTYLGVSERPPGYFTTLEKGFARSPKTGLKDVKKCYSTRNFMKAVVVTGSAGKGDLSRKVGHDLELVPLDNPANIKAGDDMRIQVLFKGKPVDDWPKVYATYNGFPVPGAFAFTDYADAYKDGVFTLRILQPGTWLIHVNKEEPYPDPNVCDVINYNSQLTFEVR